MGRTDGTAYCDISFSDDATQNDKDSALLQGARDNILEMVEAALQAGASLCAKDHSGKTAIAYARAHKNKQMIARIRAQKKADKQESLNQH